MTFRLDGCRLCRVHTPNSGITFLFPARRVKNGILFLVSLWVLPFVGVLAVLCSLFSFSLSLSLSLLSLSPFLFFFLSLFLSFSCLLLVSSLFLLLAFFFLPLSFSSSLCFVSFPCRFLLLVLSAGWFCVCAGSSSLLHVIFL